MPATVPHLQDYSVSETRGFLSDDHPLTTFTNSYFTPWDDLISHLPTNISTGSVRKQIHSLPLLDFSKLSTEPEYRRAYVVLGFLTHAYVWSTGSNESPAGEAIVPPQLAEPFLQACEVLGLRPVVSYAGLCLWNWKVNSSPSEEDDAASAFYNLDQLDSLASFTGSRGEDAFYHVPVLIEAEGGPLISLLLNAITASSRGDTASVISTLQTSEATIARMMQHLPRLYARLDADEFYNQMRPFMAGGKGKLPRGGMVFRRSDGSEYVAECIGGSAAQSSLFQFLDLVLGTEHKVAAGSKETLFQEMRSYMPGKHRDFLEEVAKLPNLRTFVEKHPTDEDLNRAYNDCMKQLRSWRSTHIAIVSKYIVGPGLRAGEELTGTGGSSPMPFLKQSRDETVGMA